jgi:steroid delta-isomerase-like uncharacterized protein
MFDNTQIIRDLIAAWNSHDPERVAALYTQDYEGKDVGEPEMQHGPEAIYHSVSRYLSAFPDLEFTEDEIIVDGDRIAVVWTARATHRGPIMNIPPTGRRICLHGMSRHVIAGGKIVRSLNVWDLAGLLREIGLLPKL